MYIDTYSKNFKTYTAMKNTVFMNSSFLGWGEGAEAWEGYKRDLQSTYNLFLKERRSEASVRSS